MVTVEVAAGETTSIDIEYNVPGSGGVYVWTQYQGGMPHRDVCVGVSDITETSARIFVSASMSASYVVRWFAMRL